VRVETVLAAGIAVVLAASVFAAVATPGVLAEREPEEPPGRLDIREVTIAPGDISGGVATLSVTTYLEHRGGVSGNVTVRLRAVDLDSGLVETTREVDVGEVAGDREVRVPADVSVAREGGYRIEALLYRDGRQVGSAARVVRGVGTLQSGGRVAFHRFRAGLPPIQYSVAAAGPNRTTLSVSAYLTNRGAAPSGNLTVELIVRQAESNVVAARSTVPIGGIPAGETSTPETTVTVPSGYNYHLDALVREGDVVVDTARSVANLDPTERVEANVTVRDVGLRVEDFERTDDERAPQPRRTTRAEGGHPGFGLPAAATALAIAAIAAIARRRRIR
jgi:hypothetical protein